MGQFEWSSCSLHSKTESTCPSKKIKGPQLGLSSLFNLCEQSFFPLYKAGEACMNFRAV